MVNQLYWCAALTNTQDMVKFSLNVQGMLDPRTLGEMKRKNWPIEGTTRFISKVRLDCKVIADKYTYNNFFSIISYFSKLPQ